MAGTDPARDQEDAGSAAEELRRHAEERLDGLVDAYVEEDVTVPGREGLAEAVHELRVHQIELEMQNEELRRSQLELDTQRAKYFDLFELAPVGYVTYEETGIIRDANLTANRMMGVDRQMLVGKPFSAFVFPADRDAFYLRNRAIQLTGVEQSFELRMQRIDRDAGGRTVQFWALLEGRPQRTGDGEKLVWMTLTDISDRKQVEEELRQTTDYLESLFDYASTPIIVWDPEQRIMRFNRAFGTLTGLRAQDVFGQSLDTLFPPGRLEEMRRLVASAGAGERGSGVEIPILGADGTVRTVLWNSATVYGKDRKTPLAIIAHGQDITQRKQSEEELRQSEEELRQLTVTLEQRVERRTIKLSERANDLEAALKIKDAFLASMSHELRTPLNSIIGFSSIMESGMAGDLPAEAHKQIGFVLESGKQLLSLVDTLLDSASIAAGVLKAHIAPFELGELLVKVESTMGPGAQAKQLEFEIRAPKEPVTIVSDQGRIREVVFSLIGNAIKFTEQGSVTLDVTLDADRVSFSVTDTGVGIASDDLANIMEPFRQLPQPGIAKTQGAGLGLSICARIAAALGGEVTVASQLGAGSTFTLIVPVLATDESGEQDPATT